jgi:hypothetical protein
MVEKVIVKYLTVRKGRSTQEGNNGRQTPDSFDVPEWKYDLFLHTL